MTKLTPDLQEKFIKLLQLGVPHKYACEACNISEQIYHIWMKLGKNKTKGKYFEFFESVQRTNSEAMAFKLASLEKASQKGNVTAITWFLEHKYPKEFGNKLEINANLQHSNSSPIQIVIVDSSKKDVDADNKQTEGRGNSDPPPSDGEPEKDSS